MRTNTAALRVALLTALGLAGCGGTSRVHESTGGDGPSTGGDGTTAGGSTSSGGTGGSNSSGGASGGAAQNPFPCVDPTDYGNIEQCAGDIVHRKAADACSSLLPRPDAVTDAPDAACTHDTDCTAFPNGYCGSYLTTGKRQFACQYGCVVDSDCGTSGVCLCGDFIGTCTQADCVTDADCTPGFLCTESDQTPGCREMAFTCQSPSDTCGGDGDCDPEHPVCSVGMPHGARTCVIKGCVVD